MKKCGLYLRVSTEEQAAVKEGSLKVQRFRLEALVKSKSTTEEKWHVSRVYTERGYSGKDLNRPQMQELLNDIQQNKINVVMCTRVDRITRSLLDFYSLIQTFNQHEVDFVCLDDYFDTSTPIGRMSLKIILILAELEREQVSDRTKKCLRTRALRGLWNGGHVIGYDIDNRNPGYLKVNESEKKLVNLIFKSYLSIGNCKGTCRFLNNSGYHTKEYSSKRGIMHRGNSFHDYALSHLLTNKLYIGMIEVNKDNKNKEQSTLPPEQRYQVVPGKHPLIVDTRLFTAVQNKIAHNRRKTKGEKPPKKHFYLLENLLHCEVCGFPMKKTWSKGHGGIYNYYKCICRKKYIKADALEKKILQEVRKHVFGNFEHFHNSNTKIINGSMNKYKLIHFSRRVMISKGINQKNILEEIIRKVYYKQNELYIELR